MHKNKTDCSFKNDFTPSCDKLALVSINRLVTRLVFISVSTKDVDTKYSIYYQVLSIKYSLDKVQLKLRRLKRAVGYPDQMQSFFEFRV